ncbi:hypothetical protein BgiMline_003373 [Biomphalaria glabrata]
MPALSVNFNPKAKSTSSTLLGPVPLVQPIGTSGLWTGLLLKPALQFRHFKFIGSE